MIGEGGRGAKKRKKPQNSCRRRAGNGGDMGGKRKKCRKERVGSVAANSDNLGSCYEPLERFIGIMEPRQDNGRRQRHVSP